VDGEAPAGRGTGAIVGGQRGTNSGKARRLAVVLQRVWAGVLDVGRGSDEVLRGQSGDELHDDERRGRENREEGVREGA
jgi:hypothetical protein